MAFASIAGRSWFLSFRFFAYALGGRLLMPLAITFVGLVSLNPHTWQKSEAAFTSAIHRLGRARPFDCTDSTPRQMMFSSAVQPIG